MKYSTIYKCDISDGPGTRVGLYTQGCYHKCPGCFNSNTWDINGGKELTEEIINKIFDLLSNDNISGLSIVGGDPLCLYDDDYLERNGLDNSYREPLTKIITDCKMKFPNKTIWLWTGFLWEDIILKKDEVPSTFKSNVNKILPYIDVIVDGPFMEEYKQLNLKFKGSTNQRIIDVQKSLMSNDIIELK